MSARVHLQNIPAELALEELTAVCRELFEHVELELPTDDQGRHQGFAVLTFDDFPAAEHAVSVLQNRQLRGAPLHAQILGRTNFHFSDGSSVVYPRDHVEDSVE